jgi:hypothetical protein
LSCPYLRAIFGRHHPLRHSANESSRIRTSVKLRQKAATNLSQFAAFCHWQLPQFVAFGSMQLNGFQYRSTLAVHALEYTLKLTTRTNGSERLKVEIMP